MKQWWLDMSWFRRVLLIWMAAAILGFGIAGAVVREQQGVAYGDDFFRCYEEGDTLRYAGKVDGERAEYTVDGEWITYRWGEFTYGPYRVREDSAAVPETDHWSGTRGVEITDEQGAVLFRGGWLDSGGQFYLVDENGAPFEIATVVVGGSGGVHLDSNGNVISDEEEHRPSMTSLTKLVLSARVTYRGSLGYYLLVTLLALLNIAQICFPGLFFRLRLWPDVRNIEAAEPSDFYIAMERIEWVLLAIFVPILYWVTMMTVA